MAISSPPYLPAISDFLILCLTFSATSLITSSPFACPNSLLILEILFTSSITIDKSCPDCSASTNDFDKHSWKPL